MLTVLAITMITLNQHDLLAGNVNLVLRDISKGTTGSWIRLLVVVSRTHTTTGQDVEAFHEEIQRLRSQRTVSEVVRDGKRGSKRDPAREPNRDQLPLLPADTPAAGTGK